MTTSWRGPACVIAAGLLFGCGGDDEAAPSKTSTPKAETPSSSSSPSESASSKKVYDLAQAGSISGVVHYAGDVPEPKFQKMVGEVWCTEQWPDGGFFLDNLVVNDGLVKDAFVWIKSGLEAFDFETPSEPVKLHQLNCLYQPRVVGVMTGQPLWATSDDHVMHNIHTKPKRNKESNKSLPYPDKQGYRDFEFKRPEIMIEVVCDVHAWMKGWIGVVEHPFYAVTGVDGAFTLQGVPPGDYVLGVWSEKLGEKELSVKVGEKAAVTGQDVTY